MFHKTTKLFHSQPRQVLTRIMPTKLLKDTFAASVNSVQPQILIRDNVRLFQRHLAVRGAKHKLSGPCHMVGFGKAVHKMALEMEAILGGRLQRALVVVPEGTFKENTKVESNVEFIEGAENNLPDFNAMEGAKKIKKLVETLNEDDLLIVLISGGGSALLPLPKPPITLEEKLKVVKNLSRSGADICELNCVRKQLSILKGGGLAELAYPARVVSLILSDIIGDPLDFIASGPTVPNLDEPTRAKDILKKYSLYDTLPKSIKKVLNNATKPKVENFEHVTNYVIGNNLIAASAAKNFVEQNGIQSTVVSTEVQNNVNEIAKIYIQLAKRIVEIQNGGIKKKLENDLKKIPWKLTEGALQSVMAMDFTKDVCLIFAGEPTVVVEGSGLGGRSQHLALAFSLALEDLEVPNDVVWLLSAGTDGADGPTNAAGAIGGKGVGPEAKKYLKNSDSYGFFKKFRNGERLIVTGHTGTNVMDIHLLLIRKQ